MPATTESVRWNLLEAVERCYYTGATAGEPWLETLAGFLHVMHRDDRRLVRLAIAGRAMELAEFIALTPPTAEDKAMPSSWLDAYVDWSLRTP